jgi:phospholipid-binding lipoprotein MlaA
MTRNVLTLILAVFLVGCATTSAPPNERHPDDPWEPYNRSVYAFNRAVDRSVVRPVARGYNRVAPEPVKTGVSNFFRNLRSPIVMANLLVQGRGRDLESEFQRFFTNTVYGVGGLFDLASAGGVTNNDADFGQTLAHWGWEESRFFMLPLLGPSTVRDAMGVGVDSVGDYPWRVALSQGTYGLLALRVIDTRVTVLPLDRELADAYDEYILVRDGWLQRRDYFVTGGESDTPDYEAWLDEDLE